MSKKLTNEIVDKRLENSNIKRLDDYIDSQTVIKWGCLVPNCNYFWETTPDSILNAKSGCPRCNNNEPLTDNIIDQKLIDNNRMLKRIETVFNSKTNILWQCLSKYCNNIWEAKPSNIIYNYSDCPKCNVGENAKIMINTLSKYNISFNIEYNFKNFDQSLSNYKFDIYIPNIKIAIEYNGAQHYRPVQFGGMNLDKAKQNFIYQQNRDEYKRQFCKDNNIKLIEIDGRKYTKKKLEKYIINNILPLIIV